MQASYDHLIIEAQTVLKLYLALLFNVSSVLCLLWTNPTPKHIL